MEVFVNGAPVASDDYTGGLDAGLGNFEPLVIGAGNGLATPGTGDLINDFFSGTIDEFGIYDRALSAVACAQMLLLRVNTYAAPLRSRGPPSGAPTTRRSASKARLKPKLSRARGSFGLR